MEKENKTPRTETVITIVLREEILFTTYRKVPLLVPSCGYPTAPCRCGDTAPPPPFPPIKP